MILHPPSRRDFLISSGSLSLALPWTTLGAVAASGAPATNRSVVAAHTKSASDAIDGYIKSEMRKRGMVGLSIAVVRQGQLLKATGYGIANLEHQVPVTAHTRFRLDSLSKLFTTVAVMQLVEQSKLRLNDPISRWLNNLQASWSGVTVGHLLSHSSGIVDDYSEEFHGSMLVDYDNATLFERARTRPLEFQPGAKARYNNLGFTLQR